MFIPPGIHFTDANGREVIIHHANHNTYHVLIDRYLLVTINKESGGWRAHTSDPNTTADDLQLLVEILDKGLADGRLK